MNTWTYRELLADGMSPNQVRDAVRVGTLHRVASGLYLEGVQPPLVEHLRVLRSALPDEAVFGFHTAAHLYGFGVIPSGKVHVVTPAGTPPSDLKSVASHQAVLPFGDPVEVHGLPCLPPERCAVDLARAVKRLDTLAVFDAALRSRRCTADDLRAEAARHDGLRGIRQARAALPYADPRPECRQESQLRFVMIDGGLPAPEPQLWVYDERDEPTFRLDTGYREQQVGGEYDGRSHVTRERMRADRARHNWLAAHGWNMRYYTDQDLYHRPAYILSTMRSALGLSSI
ncbi:type IV toxin-antitoxin system AbiEi family antitoxin domain-containing protein [Phytohabitans rumicis]|uniref:DUF559 domain-containing protein n=1 Tax=Phytohabitans rumicis TaxID=1076125 RepID=A0A6V8LAF2_9ACTN|nr:type IV toxin-antitoxin system AbiEi family antitoxin domain-containing protein [Phytohabitans rumicis]GFJ91761.1 hypothetical protein Prum_054030 [Phytohabitans rumicis]